MTEHSLDFFLEAKYNFAEEYTKRIKNLGAKLDVYSGWDIKGKHEIYLAVTGNIPEEQKKKIKTIIPKEYKVYKVKLNFS